MEGNYGFLVTQDSVNITGFTIQAGESGILLGGVKYCNVNENDLYSNTNGIYLNASSNNIIQGNNITSSTYGVRLDYSSNNTIRGNNLADNDIGIELIASSDNGIIVNFLINNYNCSIILYNNSSGNVLAENNIRDNTNGISLQGSSDHNIIFRNTITATDVFGIYVRTSSYNNLTRNDIRDNYGGVGFESCSDNFVSNNNFVNNSMHVSLLESVDFWNANYPICGNYWDNYNGTDFSSGPYQNETGSDGIGDTAYTIDVDNVDHYPLMDPWILGLSAQNHMIVAYPGCPRTLDPAVSYDTASLEPIMNVYETLIFFDEENTNQFVPRLATNWHISEDGLTYTFTIRQVVRFHNNEILSTEDVEYSFERLLVIDDSGGPAWMLYEPLFDKFGSREGGSFVITGQQIDDAITRNETAVTLHLTKPYPPFMQILAQAWSSVLCKKWCAEIGDWPGTWNNWTLYNRPYKTAIENQTTEPPGPHINAMCGTGPFRFDYYQTGVEWSIVKFDNYWGGWPAAGSSGFLQRVTAKTISNWEVRKNMLLEGQLDYVTVPRTSIDEVLGQPGVRCIYPLEDLICWAMFFTFNISTSSPYLGVLGGLPIGTFNQSGIPPDFFSDINVRKGFTYAFNYSKLIEEELRGEAYQPATPIIPGLPFYNPAQEKYSIDLDRAMDYFGTAWGGQLWDNGFNFTICYNEGNTLRQKACEIIKANVESLNSKFHIQIQSIPWDDYLDSVVDHEQPTFIMGWLADYADPHDFVYGFMYSGENFALWQKYSNETIDTLMRAGIGTMNETVRRQVYYEIQMVYHDDCPSVPLYQSIGRRFERDWVRGWYYNPLLWSMNYFYVQWKGSMPTSTRYSWPTFHHDLANTGYTESPAPNTNQTQWKYETGYSISSSPTVADGKVYVGSADFPSKVYCLDAYTGAQIWNYTTGNTVESSPAVADGKVYVGANDGNVYCLDALTGTRIWNYTTNGMVISSPAVADGNVYVGSDDGNVYCLNSSTGVRIWNYSTGGWIRSSPAVVCGEVYVGSWNGKVYCLDAMTGAIIWNYTTGNSVESSPAVADNKVYIGSYDCKVYCLSALTGAYIWSYTTGNSLRSSPAVAYGKVYIGSWEWTGDVYCFNALTGVLLWSYRTGDGVHSSPAVADGKVYVGSYDNKTHCFDASTGAFIWSYTTDGPVMSSPAVADGMVFISSYDYAVYAFGNVIRVPEDYNTIQEAIDAAPSGATIIIAPGIYHESIVINKTLTIIGLPGSAPTFSGGGSGIAITLLPGASGSIIAGIVITNWDQGILIIDATNIKIYDNIMSLINYNSITLEGTNAANNLIYSNIFQENTVAINLTTSAISNTIYKNIITLNTIGLSLESSGNNITANTIAENQVGIDLSNSNNNIIYHNNFISNDIQVLISTSTGNTWDNGYPSGGNYWSIHTHVDSYSGPSQNQPNSDGINDTQYTIAVNNIDRYPLTQPFSPHDIGTTNVITSKTVVGQGFAVRLELKIINYGMFDETFTVTFYANAAVIATQTVTLTKRNSIIIFFTWNTAGFPKGNYTIKAVADTVAGETETGDNTFIDGLLKVVLVGDVNGDDYVEMMDYWVISQAYGSQPGEPNWNPNADIYSWPDGDGFIEMMDYWVISQHYGEH
jgi:peptide/nickel transport system substrate-binding protein